MTNETAGSRLRRTAIGVAMAATLPFGLAACAEDEPIDENIVEEDGGGAENEGGGNEDDG